MIDMLQCTSRSPSFIVATPWPSSERGSMFLPMPCNIVQHMHAGLVVRLMFKAYCKRLQVPSEI